MMTAPVAVLRSGMKVLPLFLVVMAVLSVPSRATSAQSDTLRQTQTAFRDYGGDSAYEDRGARHFDPIGGSHVLREVDGLTHFPRRTRSGLDSLSGVTFGWNKRLDSLSGITFGNQKRNFDEIDRSGFDGFVKRNFDEIDRADFGSFVKRNAPLLLARRYDKENR